MPAQWGNVDDIGGNYKCKTFPDSNISYITLKMNVTIEKSYVSCVRACNVVIRKCLKRFTDAQRWNVVSTVILNNCETYFL